MVRRFSLYFVSMVIIPLWSCGHIGNNKDLQKAESRIVQQDDGTISLKLDNAGYYYDVANPSNNTADWNIVISKPGRFNVWLSSATKDTTDLNYANSVRISLLDTRLEVNPACDKIVKNSGDVPSSYYRADSFMGSIYVSEPGEYNIQVISEKVVARNVRTETTSKMDDTMFMSVILTPAIR